MKEDSVEIPRQDISIFYELHQSEDKILHEVTDKMVDTHYTDSEIPMITDEVFDFDLPMSPERGGENKARQDDDEVFFGPVGFTEKCVAAGVAEETIEPLSPLHPGQWAELFKEAHSVAYRIANVKTPVTEGSTSETPHLPSCHGQLSTLQRGIQNSQNIVLPNDEATEFENLENISPKKPRKRSDTFTIESPVHTVLDGGSPSKERKRRGTFTKEEPVENLLFLSQSAKPSIEETKTVTWNRGLRKHGPRMVSRLKAPSSQLMRNTSQPNLTKSEGKFLTTEVHHTENPAAALPDTSLPRETDNCKQPHFCPSRTGVRRVQSMNVKSGIPVVRGPKRALPVPSQKTSVAFSNETGDHKGENLPAAAVTSQKSAGISQMPSTKPLLIRSGQLQWKSFAFGRCRAPAQSGPVKVPAQSSPKMSSTIERPYNPALTAAAASGGNGQCPSTPSGQRQAVPKLLTSMRSKCSTPAKSSCSSSSACGGTPRSLIKGISLLPSPLKRQSQVPSSQMSGNSSNKARFSLASSTDTCDSPVFDNKDSSKLFTMRRSSAFKPGKVLVQNTPDLPKRTLSRWSPLRRQPAQLEDEVSMCTKRLPRPT